MSNLKPLGYYKWHWQDWRANRHVQRMTYIERGLYRELLDECWSEGGIPDDIEKLADICGCHVDVMANAWQMLGKCFVAKGGLLVNERLEKERTEKDAHRVKMAQNGKTGGISKSMKDNEKEAIASKSQANASNCHIEEKRREEKILLSSGDDSTRKTPDYQAIVEIYHRVLPRLPSVKLLTDKRKSAIRSCCNLKPSYYGLDFWEAYFEAVSKSQFLHGENNRGWKADFDFLTKTANLVKIIEGSYR